MANQPIVYVDVREPDEYTQGHLVGAVNIPPQSLQMPNNPELAKIPKDAEVVLYCRSGMRSAAVMHILKELGYSNVTNGINQQQIEWALRKTN
jgi:phage shock protein E